MKEICLRNFSAFPPNFATVHVRFSSTSYGNRDVSVIFDFGYAPRIVRYLGVVVAPEKHLIKTLAFKPTVDSEQNNELVWLAKHKLVPFDCNSGTSAWHTPVHLSHAIVILRYGIELETCVRPCSTNHILIIVDSLFSLHNSK